MNIQEYINLYFERFPEKKYMILKGDFTGGKLKFYEPVENPTNLNDFNNNPVLPKYANIPKNYFIISKYEKGNNFYNFQVLEMNKLYLGFGLSIDNNFNFYMTQSESLFGNIILTKKGTFKLNRYNNINKIFDYADCDIIALKLFEKETGIHLD